MTETHFRGVFPYLVSPIRASGEVDAEVLARLSDDLIKGGLQLQGYAVGDPLPPQASLSREGVEEVRRALVAIQAI